MKPTTSCILAAIPSLTLLSCTVDSAPTHPYPPPPQALCPSAGEQLGDLCLCGGGSWARRRRVCGGEAGSSGLVDSEGSVDSFMTKQCQILTSTILTYAQHSVLPCDTEVAQVGGVEAVGLVAAEARHSCYGKLDLIFEPVPAPARLLRQLRQP